MLDIIDMIKKVVKKIGTGSEWEVEIKIYFIGILIYREIHIL